MARAARTRRRGHARSSQRGSSESNQSVPPDAAGRQFASAERRCLSHTGPTGQFVEGRLAAKAPAGTAAVRFQVLLAAAGLETGGIVVDDAKLVIAD